MVSEFKYLKVKEGQLSEIETSKILYKCVFLSMKELNNLLFIANNTEIVIVEEVLCPFLKEFCFYFELYELNSALRKLEHSIRLGIFDIAKYHTFVRQWTVAVCGLRNRSSYARYRMPAAS